MMQRFFVFIECDPGKTYDLGMKIAKAKIKHVSEISSISGKWDLLLRVEIDNRLDVGREVISRILELGNVRRTKTIVAYSIFDPEDVYFSDDGDP